MLEWNCQLISLSTYPKGQNQRFAATLKDHIWFCGLKDVLILPQSSSLFYPTPQRKSLNSFQEVCTESISDWCKCDQPNWSCQKWYKRLEPESKQGLDPFQLLGGGGKD